MDDRLIDPRIPVVDLENGHLLAWHVAGPAAPATEAGAREGPAGGQRADTHVLIPVELDELIETSIRSDTGHDPEHGVLMLSQTALLDRPAHTLRIIEQVRSLGWRIGVRGVGVDAATLALLPLLDPDVIEFDPTVIRFFDSTASSHVFASVGARAEQSGALILAAGVDSPELRVAARAAGAIGGRGAASTMDSPRRRGLPLRRWPTDRPVRHLTPSRIVFAEREVRVATKQTLIRIGHRLEAMATAQLDDVLLLGSFQHVRFFTLATGARWQLVAKSAALVVALAEEMDPEPAPGVRGVRLDRSDPLRQEWDLVVLTAHFAAVLASRDLGDHGPDEQRRFEYLVSYDRDRVLEVARAMMTRVPGEPR